MTVKQFNANWVCHEDRIYLRFNTLNNEEYRFWLTRQSLTELFSKSREVIKRFLEQNHRPEVAEMIEGFQREKIKNKITAGEGFQKSNTYPIGDLPLLILKTNLVDKKKFIILSLQVVSKRKIDIPVNIKALQSLVYLLEKVQEQACWLLSSDRLNDKTEPVTEVAMKKLVH